MRGIKFWLFIASLVGLGLTIGAAILIWETWIKTARDFTEDFWEIIHREEWLQYDGPHDDGRRVAE